MAGGKGKGEEKKTESGKGKKYRGMCLGCWGTGAMVVTGIE